jgi:hypothetical protein
VASPRLGHSGQSERIEVKHSRIRRALKGSVVSGCYLFRGTRPAPINSRLRRRAPTNNVVRNALHLGRHSHGAALRRWVSQAEVASPAARTYAAWRPFAVRVASSSASISASLISAISASVILTNGGRTTARGSLPSSTSASFMRLCISMNGSA